MATDGGGGGVGEGVGYLALRGKYGVFPWLSDWIVFLNIKIVHKITLINHK